MIQENITAVLSMLHEPPGRDSATRTFRQDPVLAWTLERLCASAMLGSIAIMCWDDQVEEVSPIAAEHGAHVVVKTPRTPVPSIAAITAARKFSDGWRGGLLATCDFDLGFHAAWVQEIVAELRSDAVVLVDPSSGLVDPRIIDALVAHGRAHPDVELCFSQAAPGLGGALLRPALLQRLATAGVHPGRLLSYLPDHPARDPIAGDGCLPVPAAVARTTRSFKLDSLRQISRITRASVDLNGQLLASDAEELVRRLTWSANVDDLPRDVVLELTTRRLCRPVFAAAAHHAIERPDMTLELAARLLGQLGAVDDLRLTLGGGGDPLVHPECFDVIELARAAGIHAICVETDLLADAALIGKLAASEVDVVAVHIPAMTPRTYEAVMGTDGLALAVENIRRFVTQRQARSAGIPLVVPIFTKCAANIAEMEQWYDQWLRALGSAVIAGPTSFAGAIPDLAVADMSPRRRTPCRRISSRMTVLSDGTIASCEEDALARQKCGDATRQPLADIWQRGMSSVREAHLRLNFAAHSVCAGCREWHRP